MVSLEFSGLGRAAFELVLTLGAEGLFWTARCCSEEEVVARRIRSLGLRILIGRFAIMVDSTAVVVIIFSDMG